MPKKERPASKKPLLPNTFQCLIKKDIVSYDQCNQCYTEENRSNIEYCEHMNKYAIPYAKSKSSESQ